MWGGSLVRLVVYFTHYWTGVTYLNLTQVKPHINRSKPFMEKIWQYFLNDVMLIISPQDYWLLAS